MEVWQDAELYLMSTPPIAEFPDELFSLRVGSLVQYQGNSPVVIRVENLPTVFVPTRFLLFSGVALLLAAER